MIKINGVEFVPHPDIGFSSGEGKSALYAHDYPRMMDNVKSKRYANLLFCKEVGELIFEEGLVIGKAQDGEKAHPGYLENMVLRNLIQNDLWFLLYFVVKPFADDAGRAMVNHPFVVRACQEIEGGPKDQTLDIWARYHYKSSIITIAETIQFQLRNPEYTTGIFSHTAPVAKDFLFTIKSIFENEKILFFTHPDVVWGDCKKDSPLWSQAEGIILKRKTNRKEASISAHGLVEGMPTGLHFERRVYDDITTNDTAKSVDVQENIKHAFDVSQNLRTLVSSHHRVTGTYYSHLDPLLYVRDMKTLGGDPMYHFRLKPATEDGTVNGKPVLMTQEALDAEKVRSSFNCQQLLDPTPSTEQRLNFQYMIKVSPTDIPRDVYNFMMIDQAGDAESNKSKNTDSWAIGVLGVEPYSDDIGQSKIFLKNLWVDVCGESEAIDKAVNMYIEAGVICRIGVEKVGLSTTHIHIANALRARGRFVEFTDDRKSTGVLLRPAGRHKKKFIEAALAWPLNNSKLFYSSEIPSRHINRLEMEMRNFPLWYDDALNMMAYLYDVLKDYSFTRRETEFERIIRQRAVDNYNPLTYGLGVA